MSQRRKTMSHSTVTKPRAIACAIFLTSILTCDVLLAAQQKTGEQPNILFLFADDLTYEAIRAFGLGNAKHKHLVTPLIRTMLVELCNHIV